VLAAKTEVLAEPWLPQTGQLDAVHGTGRISAQDVIAEIGTDMTVFPAAPHLVSWARWCPQVAQSGGKRKGASASGRGNPYLSAALGEISISATRTQSFLGARYRRLVNRMPKKKALVPAPDWQATHRRQPPGRTFPDGELERDISRDAQFGVIYISAKKGTVLRAFLTHGNWGE